MEQKQEIEFDEISVCPHCGAPTEERHSGDEGWTFCSDECGCLEGDKKVYKFECQKCYKLLDEPKCNCMETTETKWEAKKSSTFLGGSGDEMELLFIQRGGNTLNAEGDWEFEEIEEIAALLNSETAADRDLFRTKSAELQLKINSLESECDRLKEKLTELVSKIEEHRKAWIEETDSLKEENERIKEKIIDIDLKRYSIAEALANKTLEWDSLKEESELRQGIIDKQRITLSEHYNQIQSLKQLNSELVNGLKESLGWLDSSRGELAARGHSNQSLNKSIVKIKSLISKTNQQKEP